MKIAFIHYHLKPGGVTTVLRQQVEALKTFGSLLVIAGEFSELSFPADTALVPGLGYDGEGVAGESPTETADSILDAINSKWKGGCDVLHVHNPTLAKNKNFLKIIGILQEKGLRLLLQIHDFAEDGRPLSYYAEEYTSDCHYGVINSRDYDALLAAGLKEAGLHRIYNTIDRWNSKALDSRLKDFVLYPIRAIRRKNIGEAILVSLFFQNRETLVVTLPPSSSPDIESYTSWREFVGENNLKVIFDAGLSNDFASLVQSCRFILTTSISEGFGFSFLDPWAARKLLWGRMLPDICLDFEERGIGFDHMYTRLQAPIEWIGEKEFQKKWRSTMLRCCTRFNHNPRMEWLAAAFASMTADGRIDFCLLDEKSQKKVISRIIGNQREQDRLVHLNPFLARPGIVEDEASLINNNCQAVVRHFDQTAYLETLKRIYTQVVENPVQHKIDKKILLSRFMKMGEFSLLKWGDYVE